MRIVISIILVFLIKLNGLAQPVEFFKTYDFGINNNPLLTSIIEINNKIYCNGNIKNPNQKVLIIKSDFSGNLIDTDIVGNDTGSYYSGTFINPSPNLIFIPGNYENSTTHIYNPLFLFLDTSINLIEDSLYSNYFAHFEGNVKIKNNYYFAGNTKCNNNGDTIPSINEFFWKTDSSFNHITHNSIGFDNITIGNNCIIAGYDNNLLLGGLSLANGNQQDWYLVNVDTNGAVLGEYYYGHPTMTDSEGMKSISQGSDSSYFLTGKYYQYDFGPGNYYYSATVVKINRLFQTIWTKRIGSTVKGMTINKIIQTYDGNQAILTQRSPLLYPLTVYSQVSKFTNNGDILWSRNYYQGDTTNYIRYRAWDMIETSDSGFALCGSAFDTTNVGPYQQAWLVKTDSIGCDDLRSCNDTALVVEILNYPDTLCQNDTNFVDVSLKGRSAPYSLYANGTLALDSIYYPYTLPLWIDTTIMVFPTDTGWQSLIVNLHEPWERTAGDTVQVYVKNCISTYASQDFYNRKVEIYPNPASTELHVKIRGVVSGAYSITLYDIQGKPIRSITTNESETLVDISQLPVGVYGVKVVGRSLYKMEKVVKLSAN